MSTAFELDSSVYVEISTASDVLIQNVSKSIMYVVFSGSLPSVDTTARTLLNPNDAVQKIAGTPVGNVYARMGDYLNGREGRVVVS